MSAQEAARVVAARHPGRQEDDLGPASADAGGPSTTGVTAPAGFRAAGVHCGLRRAKLDLGVIVSDLPAAAAGVFTRNRVKAAPVLVAMEALGSSGGRARVVVVNSGNANACTGPSGMRAARVTVSRAAELAGVPADEVLVSSTGVIGQPLAVDRIVEALPGALGQASPAGGSAFARAIMTTDTCAKESVRRVAAGYTIGGAAKGSGMIHPDMATTLAFVTTDAAVAPETLQTVLRRATDRSFNRVTVDGDTSTNDMIALLANGAAGVDAGDDLEAFEAALTEVLVDLARMVARDGEGATRLVTVRVTGAATEADADRVARTVAGSLLVKTAVHGADANWGRVVAAAGRAGIEVTPERFRLRVNGLELLAPGYRSRFSEDEATRLLSLDEVVFNLDLGAGEHEATVWTCDLSKEYVDINASYRT